MKRLLQWTSLAWASVLLATTATAQCPDTLLYEDFQTQTIPATWSNLDLDGRADANGRPQNWYIYLDPFTSSPGFDNYVASASSWFSSPGQANNWLILDSVNICSPNVVLSWKSAPRGGPQFADGYKVLISTTGNQTTDFTDTLVVFAEDGSGTGVPSDGVVHTNYSGPDGLLQAWSRSLSAYAGQTIYIAFVHDSNDDDFLLIDDLLVGTLATNDLALTDFGGTDYTMLPVAQAPAITYRGTVRNNAGPGANPQLNVDVQTLGTSAFSGMAMMTGILPEGEDTTLMLTIPHTPSVIGTYRATGWVTSDSLDLVRVNDTLVFSYAVTDSVYAREMGAPDSDISIGLPSVNGSGRGILAQEFELLQMDDLTSLSYYRDQGRLGDSVRVVVYSMDNMGLPDSALYESDWILETNTGAGWRLHDLGANYPTLDAGTYVIGLEEQDSTQTSLGTNSAYFVPGSTWALLNGTWQNTENIGSAFKFAYLIRPNFATRIVVGTTDLEATPQHVNIYPQPVRDQLTLDLKRTAERVLVYNLNGVLVKQWGQPANNTLSVSELQTGLYFIEIELDGERLRSRFVKQ